MTYCVGVLLDDGLVMAADSRTNAGVDHLSTYRKMTVFEQPGERVIIMLSAGNLAITQAVVTLLKENSAEDDDTVSVLAARSMFRVARIVGNAIREIHDLDGEQLEQRGIEFNPSFLLGGQVKGGENRLFQVYAEGNFIEASRETPYMQIGETKYGKPVLDRIVHPGISLDDAVKCVLVSYTSTMRSNVSVGLPIDLAIYHKGALAIAKRVSIEQGDAYFSQLTDSWSEALQRAFTELPSPNLT